MSAIQTPLPVELLDKLDQVEIAADGASAMVGGRAVEAVGTRELLRLLAEALYEFLHSGQEEKKSLPFRTRDTEFERELGAVVPHKKTVALGVLRSAEEVRNGSPVVLVERDGVKVWMPKDAVRVGGGQVPGDVVKLDVSPLRPAVSPGFFVVDGARPSYSREAVLRVYLHITDSACAVAVWSVVLGLLEHHRAAYRAKVLSSKLLYPRRDALVVYLESDSWWVATVLRDAVSGMAGIGRETSSFAERLGPGVATAWEPTDQRSGMRGLSFGQHRAHVLARALLDTVKGTSPLAEVIRLRFIEAEIDPGNPARNHGSVDYLKAVNTVQA